MSTTEKSILATQSASVLKALLLDYEIQTKSGIFRYFHKGDWIPLPGNMEGKVTEAGIFKRCEVSFHSTGQDVEHSHTWLLWFNSLADFVEWTRTFTQEEMAIIIANLVISNKG